MENINLMIILIIGFISCQQITKIEMKKLSLDETQKILSSSIKEKDQKRVKAGLQPIKFDTFLMKTAQAEAKRLASKSKIDLIDIKTNLNFVVNIFQIQGIQDGKFIGKKALFTNLSPMNKFTVVEMQQPYVGIELVDKLKYYAVGFGKDMDENGIIYAVTIFLTSQKDLKENGLNEKNIKKEFEMDRESDKFQKQVNEKDDDEDEEDIDVELDENLLDVDKNTKELFKNNFFSKKNKFEKTKRIQNPKDRFDSI